MKYTILFYSILFFSLVDFTQAGSWDEINDPEGMREAGALTKSTFKLDYTFNPKIKSATLSTVPWSDSYWPTYKGGLAYRYKIDTLTAPSKLVNRITLMELTNEQKSKLSPSEKFDLFSCRYNYPFTLSELERTKEIREKPKGREWEGLCHGWAAAAINYREPNGVTLKSVDGVEIPFGSSDIKALLSYFQGEVNNFNDKGVGDRCVTDEKEIKNPGFVDINPGSFHVVLTNLIGRGKQGFIMDKTAGPQVWNHPIYGYSFEVVKNNTTPNGSEVTITMTVKWITEVLSNDRPHGTSSARALKSHSTSVYQYILELDDRSQITGGRWIGNSITNHPDFVWMKSRQPFSDFPKWAPLEKIYQASIKS